MKKDQEHVKKVFEDMLNAADQQPLPAAILTACVVGAEFTGELDHRLCLGLRYGLFGTGAKDKSSLLNLVTEWGDICEALGR